jgi:lysophospholipase L1-like esterase
MIIRKTLLVICIFLLVRFAIVHRPAPELIALGDSITDATLSYGPHCLGYRRYLQDELGIWTYRFKGQFKNSGFGIHQRRHSGVIGETVAQIRRRVETNLALFSKVRGKKHSAILIHAGTNDLRHTIKSDEEMERSLKAYDDMLTTIHNSDPDLDIYVALLIPSAGQPCDRNIDKFNPQLAALVRSKGYPNLYYVDMNAAFKKDAFGLCRNEWPKYCMVDTLHPSDAGYRTMGKQWAACMRNPKAKYCNGN